MTNTSNFETNTIAVYLTPEQAESFKKFCQYQNEFETLLANGVFNIKSGKAILNFDPIGIIQTVVIEQLVFTRKHLT